MNAIDASAVLNSAAAIALKSAAVLAIALVGRIAMRRSSAAHRHALITAAILAAIALPVISVILPPIRVVVPVRATAAHEVLATPIAQPPVAPEPVMQKPVASRAGNAHARFERTATAPVSASSPAPHTSILAASEPQRTSVQPHITISELLVGLWIVGSFLVAIRFVVVRLRLRALLRRCQPASDSRLQSVVVHVADDLAICHPHILESGRVTVPFATGIFRPVVVLPRGASAWSDTRLIPVLRHEFGHILRHDGIWQAFAEIATALYWFNPLVWLAMRAQRADREHACDDLVIGSGVRASQYAHDLLEIA